MLGISPVLGVKLIYGSELSVPQGYRGKGAKFVELEDGEDICDTHISDNSLGISLGYQSEINGTNTLPVRNRGKGLVTQSSTVILLAASKEETCSTSVKVHSALE